MEPSILSLIDSELNDRELIGAISFRRDGMIFHGSLLHDFDYLVLVVCCDIGISPQIRIEHSVNGKQYYQLIYVGRNDIKRWAVEGQNREIVQCFLHGDVIMDNESKLTALRQDLLEFGDGIREQRKLNEYAKLLKTFVEAKKYTQDNDLMDAYYCVLQALKHYARIELIDQGILPEISVWQQIRPINSVAYKLFEELTDSKETLEQRIQLVLLASEFSVMSKMEDCCSFLLNILGSRKSAWSIQELVDMPELIHIKAELPMMLRKLVYRSLVTEVTVALNGSHGDIREIRYLV
ncbi:hypothetical protein D3C76_327510 [compost metagenome]